jgi:LmbE family N-acetylglucosaminyl deacetylase
MKVAAIGAHPDDMEFGAGGTLAKHVQAGDEVHAILCTLGGVSGDPNERREETYRAASILGIERLTIMDYPVSKINKPSAEFAREITKLLRAIRPDRVYSHTPFDYHQVHYAVNKAVVSACNKESIRDLLFFEIISSTSTDFKPNAFVDITDFIELKIKSLQAHKSQAISRIYLKPNVIRSLANTRYVWGKVGPDPDGFAEAYVVQNFSIESMVYRLAAARQDRQKSVVA